MAVDETQLNGNANVGLEDEQELVFINWNGEKIEMSDAMFERALTYATKANTDRALPDVRDGLKPVQRRIVYTMDKIGARSDRKYMKSAKTVGECMGSYHPHGDAAIYAAMVRMAQHQVMNAALVDGQGNWGSLDDNAGASRYTEARLTKIADEMLSDLDKEIVEFRPTYDGSKTEPSVLPVTFPNLLVNGTKGIGWSMAVEIPPHNLAETIDAAIYLLDNPDATTKQLMKKLPGPDFPSGGVIADPDKLHDCYDTGRGTIRQQGTYRVENVPGNQQAVVITELPYLVGSEAFVKQIVAAARAEKITEITELPIDGSDKNGLKIIVKCKRGGNVQALIAQLLKNTDLEKTVSFNLNVLVTENGQVLPRVLTLKQILEQFNAFRIEVVTKRLEKEKREKVARHKDLSAFRAALDVIDQVVKIIRSSKDDDDSKAKLIKLLKWTPYGEKKPVPIDEDQAQRIIDMPLKRLNQLNRYKLDDEIKALVTRLNEIVRILSSKDGVREIVKEELRETKKQFGQPRKTRMGDGTTAAVVAAGGPVSVSSGPTVDCTVYVSSTGMALVTERPKKQPTSSPLKTGDASLVAAFDSRTDQAVFAFTEQGLCYRLTLADCGIEKSGKGRPFVGLNRGDRVIGVFPVGTAPYYTFVTEQGEIKRQPEEPLVPAHAGGISCMDVPAGDRIVAAVPMTDADEIIISSAQGQALRINAEKIPVKKTPAAGGVAGMKLGADDRVVYATAARGDILLVVHETGMAKRVKLSEYPTKGRGGGGVASAAVDKPTRGDGPAGLVVAAISLTAKDTPILFSDRGQFVDFDPKVVGEGTRAAVSKKAYALGPGDTIRGVLLFAEEGK